MDEALLVEIEQTRRVVQLGRRARAEAGLKLRQPLRRLYVRGAPMAVAHREEIQQELRVKDVGFDEGPVASVQLLPNLPVLGPRLGRKLGEVRAALAAGDVEQLGDGRLIVAGEELGPDDVIRGQRVALEGWAIAEDDGISVAFDTTLDEALRLEGRVYDLVHAVNEMRKEHGLALTGRITLTLPERDRDLLMHEEWIRAEVLATEIALDPEIREPTIRPRS